MPSQYTSEKKTIGELLSMTSPSIEVPEWQRSFSWKTEEIEIFWTDLMDFSERYPDKNMNDQEYFLGSIVLVDNGLTHLLLDGQQRLATATILLSIIRDYLARYSKDAATRTSQKYVTDFDDAVGSSSFKLTLNRYDRDFFRREIQEFGDYEDAPPSPTHGSHLLIRSAREFFRQKFEQKYLELGGGKQSFDWALRVRKVLTDHLSVVAVTSQDEDNAASVFETLNDRGIGLSTPDLLRNLLLRRAQEKDHEEVIDCWKTVLEMEEATKVQEFIRHYWISLQGDVKTRKLYREIKAHVTQSGKEVDSLSFSRDLKQAAEIYKEISLGRDNDPDIQRILKGIDMLNAKSLMPAILSTYSVGTLEERRDMLSALLTLYVRYNIIGGFENTRLETVVFSVAMQLRTDRDFPSAIRRLKDLSPSDEEFIERFKTAQVRRRESARYILREIEHAKRITQEVMVETPDRVHVEHIYPQTPLAGQRWENHNSAIDRLGNLTLLSRAFNVTIKNSPFENKRPFYGQSDLLLARELTAFETWDIEAINRRQEQLSEYALSIWKFPA
jgi:uncharacterized protein with ParB-like and HNH nuclease domain